MKKNNPLAMLCKTRPDFLAFKVINDILAGKEDALDIFTAFSMLSDTYELLKKDPRFYEQVNKQIAEDQNSTLKEVAKKFGYEFSVMTRTTYDFSTCKDEYLSNLDKQIKELEKHRKGRQDELKTIHRAKNKIMWVNEETGELKEYDLPTPVTKQIPIARRIDKDKKK